MQFTFQIPVTSIHDIFSQVITYRDGLKNVFIQRVLSLQPADVLCGTSEHSCNVVFPVWWKQMRALKKKTCLISFF